VMHAHEKPTLRGFWPVGPAKLGHLDLSGTAPESWLLYP
jgi:hypothetical protein